jgi:PAT family beta-lactamase induction signal transducer AmpG
MTAAFLGVGIVGRVFTLSLLRLPLNTATFGIATIGQNAFQALAFAVATALVLRTVGHGDALAATQYSILSCATSLPLVYMQFIDGNAYALRGVPGAFIADGGLSIAVCAVLLAMLAWLRIKSTGKVGAMAIEGLTKAYHDALTIFVKTPNRNLPFELE